MRIIALESKLQFKKKKLFFENPLGKCAGGLKENFAMLANKYFPYSHGGLYRKYDLKIAIGNYLKNFNNGKVELVVDQDFGQKRQQT